MSKGLNLTRSGAVYVLRKFGDPAPKVERNSVISVGVAHTSLSNREVIQKCKEPRGERSAPPA